MIYTIKAQQAYIGTFIVEADSEDEALDMLSAGAYDDCIDIEPTDDINVDTAKVVSSDE